MILLKNHKFLFIGIILALGLSFYFYWKQNPNNKTEYKESQLKRENIEKNILATGVVQPKNRLEIKSPIAGRVEKILVEEGTLVRKGQTVIWISSTERAALLDAARAVGSEDLKKWEDYYHPTPILAPIKGMIIQKKLQQGQTFSSTEGILVMSDMLIVQAQVDETDIAEIKKDQPVTIILDAYPNNKIKAHVEKIAYDAKTVNNVTTYTVELTPEVLPEFMRSGMTASVTFNIETRANVLVIPAEAVKKRTTGEYYTLIKSEANKPVEATIQIGLNDGKKMEVLSGLNETDVIMVPQINFDGLKGKNTNPFSPMGGSRNRGR
jgi:macrolide-specific efflux system membrane fusion protein